MDNDGSVDIGTLAGQPRWAAWLAIPGKKPEDPPIKVPRRNAGGDPASVNVPSHWRTRREAEADWAFLKDLETGMPGGIGMLLGDAGGSGTAVAGIDLDSCIRDDGALEPWATAILSAWPTYGEVSPSGKGIKLWGVFLENAGTGEAAIRAALRLDGKTGGTVWKRALSPEEKLRGRKASGVEAYWTLRWFAFEGVPLEGGEARLLRPFDGGTAAAIAAAIAAAGGKIGSKGGRGRAARRTGGTAGGDNGGPKTAFADDVEELLADAGRLEGLAGRITATVRLDGRLAARWDGETGGLADETESAMAMAVAALLKQRGFDAVETTAAMAELCPNAKVSNWARTKGRRNGWREAERAWARSATYDPFKAVPLNAEPGMSSADPPPGGGGAADGRDAVCEELNREFMVVRDAGKTAIFSPRYDPDLKRRYYDRMGVGDLHLFYANKRAMKGPRSVPKSEIWLEHENRREYRGIVFDPSERRVAPGELNLWGGFAVEEAPSPAEGGGDWALARAHCRDILFGGPGPVWDWAYRWMARLVQHPGERAEVAVVLRGGQGTGKGTLGNALFNLFGQHAVHISNPDHLVGHFNAHLRDCVFLFADEALFAGDKARVGQLNALITEGSIAIEGKYRDVVTVRNLLHVMMASNAEWVIPAGGEARRYLMCDVSDAHKGDKAYFDAIAKELYGPTGKPESGHGCPGLSAMLRDLKRVDLNGFDWRRAPATQALAEQKAYSLPGIDAWWMDVLERGWVFQSRLGQEEYFQAWFPAVAAQLAYSSYEAWCRTNARRAGPGAPVPQYAFGKYVLKHIARYRETRRLTWAPIGEHETEAPNMFGKLEKRRQPLLQHRPNGYAVGTLEQAKTAFTLRTGIRFDEENEFLSHLGHP